MTRDEVDEINRIVTNHWNSISEQLEVMQFHDRSIEALPQGTLDVLMGKLYNDLSKVCKVTK